MNIRLATPQDDFTAISRIYALSWKSAYQGIVLQAYLSQLPEDRWAPMLAQRPGDQLVALSNGKYVGTSCIGPGRDPAFADWGEIVSLYLLPEAMGLGHGKLLLAEALLELQNRGFAKVYLWVLKENARARAFYERNGFRPTTDRLSLDIGGKKLQEMRYILP